jgi:hypothetical protein
LVDLSTLGTIDDYEAAADRGDGAAYNSLKSDAESGQLTTLILYVASGALAAGGVATWLLVDDAEAQQARSIRVAPSVSPDGAVGVAVEMPFF